MTSASLTFERTMHIGDIIVDNYENGGNLCFYFRSPRSETLSVSFVV